MAGQPSSPINGPSSGGVFSNGAARVAGSGTGPSTVASTGAGQGGAFNADWAFPTPSAPSTARVHVSEGGRYQGHVSTNNGAMGSETPVNPSKLPKGSTVGADPYTKNWK